MSRGKEGRQDAESEADRVEPCRGRATQRLHPEMPARSRIPAQINRLPRNKAGYPVPWFVASTDGQPDFRIIRPGGIEIALHQKLCWICGIPFRRQQDRAFVIGPMCAVNRISSEPPSHEECAVYAATACPFLATPRMRRRDRRIPEGAHCPGGVSIPRNPGVALVWVTGYKSWSTFGDGSGGRLFSVGEPKRTLWFAEGGSATRAQALASIDSGLPLLLAAAEDDGPDAVAELARLHERALAYVPAEES